MIFQKNTLLLFAAIAISLFTYAQNNVGIGTLNPDNSAVLELDATDKGLLITRVSTVQRLAITTPARGLLVYDTDTDNFWFFDGTQWVQAIGPQGPQGPAGNDGAPGPQGTAGVNGVGIVSTVDNGNGTFTFNYSDGSSFTTSNLTGPQGAQGQQGVQGIQGPQGVAGPQGPAGNDGATGPQGPAGPQGPQGPAGSGGIGAPGTQFYASGRQVFVSSTQSGNPGAGETFQWVVPSGITQIRVQIAGGGGGGGYGNSGETSGSCGGFVLGEIPVTPGETLTIFAGAGGTGYSSGTNTGRGGTGSYIARGATILGAAGGGGGGASNGTSDGNGGGQAYGLNINGGNGTSSAGGSSGNNYVNYLWNSLAFVGKNTVAAAINISGISARYFTSLFNSNNNQNYGFGGRFGSGVRGVVIVEW